MILCETDFNKTIIPVLTCNFILNKIQDSKHKNKSIISAVRIASDMNIAKFFKNHR